MSIDVKLIRNIITQQIIAAMAGKKKYENKIQKLEKCGKDEVSGESVKKRNKGRWTRLQEKVNIDDNYNNEYEVKNIKTICVLIGTRPKENPSEPLKETKS